MTAAAVFGDGTAGYEGMRSISCTPGRRKERRVYRSRVGMARWPYNAVQGRITHYSVTAGKLLCLCCHGDAGHSFMLPEKRRQTGRRITGPARMKEVV